MKVVIIGPAHPLRGGIADSSEAFARNLSENGTDAIIVTYSLQYPSFLFPGKTQYSLDPAPGDLHIRPLINSINPLSWIKAVRFIRRHDPDLVVIRYWIPFMGACLGFIAHRLKNMVPVIAVCDNIIPHEKRVGDRPLTRYFMSGCHAVVTFSKKVADEARQFTKGPVSWHPLPMDTKFAPKISRTAARKALGLDPEAPYLLFFGLVRDYKGLDLLIEALGSGRLAESEVTLLVAGEFYADKSKYLDRIEELNLGDRIVIRDEFIPSDQVHLYFSAADLVTQTYKTASQSGVTQIAYFYDCPMLVTDVGGLSETVYDQKVGYVVEPRPSAIASAIMDFFDHNRYDAFSTTVKIEKERFTWDNFRKNILDLYQTLI